MKKIFTNLFLLATLFLASTNLNAQTYKDGTWYSLYDKSQDDNVGVGWSDNFAEKAVFSPVESMTFEYKKYSMLSTNGDLTISNNVMGSEWKEKGSISYSDRKNWKTSPIITLDANISHIRYHRKENGTGVSIRNHFVKLAKHILLADGTSFGTTSITTQFANPVNINETSSEVVTVKLRSFLTEGNISITSNDSAFYVATSTYAVGANACASANGDAGKMAGGGTLGNINHYDVHIYFHPTSAGTHNGTITLTDGTSTATINVSGICNKKAPEVTSWPQVTPLTYGTPLTLDMLVGGNANVPGNFEWAELPTTLNAGTHNLVVRFVPEDQNIYATVENTISVVVNKADQTIAWDVTTTEMTVDEVLTLNATATAGDVTFAITGDAATLENNTLTAVKAGEVVITASQAGNNNYNAAEEVAHTITINKATPTVTAWPTLNDVVYGATYDEALQLKDDGKASVKGAFSITNMPADSAQVPAVGEYTFGIVFKPDMSESYNEVSDSITLKVTKNLQTITLGFADQELLIGNTLTLSATAPAGEVTFAIESAEGVASLEGNTLTALAAGKVTITATAPENENYEAATISHIVTVIKHTPEIITLPTVAPLGHGTKLTDDMLNGGETTTEGTWEFVNPDQELQMGDNEVVIRFVPNNAEHYSPIEITIIITVEKATTTISWEKINSDDLYIGGYLGLYAEASSGVAISYTVTAPEGILEYDSDLGVYFIIGYGTITITAHAEETETHKAAEMTQEVTIYDPDSNPSTNITNTTINGEKAQKIFVNGKLYIIRNNQWYDTTGKLVK
jgi:hypothetical protein